jgi:Zinc carboxypeptidase
LKKLKYLSPMKYPKYLLLVALTLSFATAALSQPLPSPDEFLGYTLGSRFTPHHLLVGYFKEIAKDAPDRVRVEQYGSTTEGRPLLLTYISSPDNIRRLEDIRLNNLRLAGQGPDKAAGDENTPVIVWLSYNVHGNEPASSEASMKMLYELVNPANTRSKEWLKNTVLIIDPCVNPDGRDRYVNWYNSVTGKIPNPDPEAREHQEPWPQGRTNHYNFDMNRDLAWQTQVETTARMRKYNDWLPQVHVDYHEQGYNEPYFFPPAAPPYHDVITPWQRSFQVTAGKNNAKYFDQHGWLYFTKEIFDLFYPSYGDTYCIYNGAIGMTFEQGGIGAGLAIRNLDGDTLTLADRLLHHYTTGMSTLEVSSQNASKLIQEFHRYFTNAKNQPAGEFKAYLLKNDPGGDRLAHLKKLLDKNRIEWAGLQPGTYNGLNYQTGKTQMIKGEKGDILINANQPRSNLIRVLFERSSRYSDSATYDITAWSVPFAYGVQAFGLNSYIANTAPKTVDSAASTLEAAYVYAVRWGGVNSARFLCQILKKGVKVRFTQEPFKSGSQFYERGTLLITRTGNTRFSASLEDILRTAGKDAGVAVTPVSSGFVDSGYDIGSYRVHGITRPRVALITGSGNPSAAGEIWYFFEQELDYPVTLVNADDLDDISWKNFDVCILPDGNYKILADKASQESLRNWVNQGGRLIALESAVVQLSKADWGIKLKEFERSPRSDSGRDNKAAYAALLRYGNRERDQLMGSTPGSIYKVELDNTHPLAFGYPDYYYTLKQDSNVYQFLKEGAWNVGVIKKDEYISGFTGTKAKEKLKDGLLFGVQPMGRGQVIYLADNPLFRCFWENGKLLFCNAVFFVGQ